MRRGIIMCRSVITHSGIIGGDEITVCSGITASCGIILCSESIPRREITVGCGITVLSARRHLGIHDFRSLRIRGILHRICFHCHFFVRHLASRRFRKIPSRMSELSIPSGRRRVMRHIHRLQPRIFRTRRLLHTATRAHASRISRATRIIPCRHGEAHNA